jgi:hypothetical protein
LLEEKFFYLYHLKRNPDEVMQWPINERKWYIERYIHQKQKENEQMEDAQKKAKSNAK